MSVEHGKILTEVEDQKKFKNVMDQLKDTRPKIDQVDYSVHNKILNNTDFTKCKSTMHVMELYYNKLWALLVFPVQDELEHFQLEIGRMIFETDTLRRENEKLKEEVAALREGVQEEGNS